MRLSFANGEHADVVVGDGATSLGTAEGNTLVLSSRDVAPWHARVTVDRRGGVLEVLDPSARTHVNARPVREKALLRCGDVLCLGKVMITLKVDHDELIETSLPAISTTLPPPVQPPRVVLRGVSGSHFGKTIAVNPRLVIGRDPECDLVVDEARMAPRHAVLENVGDAIYLRDLAATNATSVNGVGTRNAIVYAGDQLAFERSHFIVEAPGLPLRGEDTTAAAQAITEAHDAVPADGEAAQSRHPQGATWWLIGVAALIALGLVLLIQHGI
jgi:pSer/pThr/pTyr-binding forkhead associated (FHA) protein